LIEGHKIKRIIIFFSKGTNCMSLLLTRINTFTHGKASGIQLDLSLKNMIVFKTIQTYF